ncbi:MAG: hypothetical protein S0880_21080 [Actinomycetota bacterium]|nr:hypothetical protein [Actinomycetota bacterium]
MGHLRPTGRRRQLAAVLVAAALVASACGGDDDDDAADTGDETSETTEAAESSDDTAADDGAEDTDSEETDEAAAGSLADVCPETVVIQADWEPESEHGGIYELVGEGYEIDEGAKSVTGPLVSGGEETGVDVEIRIGGASVGYQPVQSLLYQDTDILMGYARVSETMASQEDSPVVSVMATMDKSPYAIYWDPETYPEAETIADLQDEDVSIFMSGEADVWQDYLVGEGIVAESQIDRSDAPKPASFVAANGAMAEAGFASAEPYMYEVEVAEWGRPVALQLIHDTGYPEYFQSLAVREADITEQADCLEQLVPILQQAHVDYIADPGPTNELIIELVDVYATGWIYTPGNAEWSIEQQAELGIVGNGDDDTLGEFDAERVQTLLDIAGEYAGIDVSGYSPEDFFTNEFIDPSIGVEG